MKADLTLAAFLLARLDEDERAARAASGRHDGPAVAEHWHWVHLGDRNPHYPGYALTDQPVDLARWIDVIGCPDGPDYAGNVSLRSTEEYPTSVGPLPHFVIHRAEEVDVAGAEHIARHDPVTVLADVAARRRIVLEHVEVHRCDWGEHHGGDLGRPCETLVLRLLAVRYAGHPDHFSGWAP